MHNEAKTTWEERMALFQKLPENFNPQDYDMLVVGAGYAGSVVARRMAEEAGWRVAIFESRPHIAGNAYDEKDEAGILVHVYGPHIYHTTKANVNDFLSRFTEWTDYQHRVLGEVHGTLMPVPFNHASMKLAFGDERGEALYQKLIERFGENVKVPLMDLRATDDVDFEEIADYVYENIFLYYTQKQWGKTPDEIDPSITARVPVFIGDDDRYFPGATFQGMPAQGYTKLFEKLLDYELIDVFLNTDARKILRVEGDQVIADGKPYEGTVIYTGPLDELFGCDLGELPYRSLDMQFETLPMERFQPVGTVNYPTSEDFTRITEFKNMTGQVKEGVTTIMREYPMPYVRGEGMTPYYAILEPENQALYQKYAERVGQVANFYPCGRLAEYRYYDMDAVVDSALQLAEELLEKTLAK